MDTYKLVRNIKVEEGYDVLVAGPAAVQSMKTGQTARNLDTTLLVQTLRENGAYLPQTELSKTMTRE